MKKKLIGLAMLVTLAAMQVMGVSAAGSKTTGMAVVGDTQGSYAFEDVSKAQGLDADTADLISQINAGTKTLDDLAKAAPEIASSLEGKSLVTSIQDLAALDGASTTDVKLTMSVPALTSGMTDVAVLHYSTARSTWEVITPDSVDLENKEVTASFKDLSPVAVIAKVDATKAADNATGTAPKTGVEANNSWMAWGCAAVVLMAAAVLTFKKKRV
ncbi:LPXTG cell wall anchor domain-containing protein [Dorea sp. AM58-8]|uniref:LPXTG cell wall anchor domain-containing protein n=1 Tax=Dorea sp. AM58-8 TaxID=2292346 RepID=UPI000E4B9CEA|nr:LPXTG cell wall anchor domain-containing protein [Dorea sp. AM58-8]RGY80175.1 LPXTG cell wall anchor domain-containing protein [Dorea sp. AM58-8]